MEKVNIYGKVESNMREIGEIIKNMEEELCHGQMEGFMRESL